MTMGGAFVTMRLAAAGLSLSVAVSASAQTMAAARADAQAGRADAAIAKLHTVLVAEPKSAAAHALLCAVEMSIEMRDAAVTECELAATLSPDSSDDALALARAYGDKAGHSGVLTGMRMVGKVRGSFERAVKLDPKSVEAISDLGEFYTDAPSIVGGGLDKARALLPLLQALSPARAHRLAGLIATMAKDYTLAETEFRAELAIAHSAEAYVDLANLDRRRNQPEKAAENAKLAIAADKHHEGDTLDAAAILLELKRDTAAAEAALRDYIRTPQKSAVASTARAHTMLGNALLTHADRPAANAEFAAALALAHEYEPARKGAGR